jgi:hypothetical protein
VQVGLPLPTTCVVCNVEQRTSKTMSVSIHFQQLGHVRFQKNFDKVVTFPQS